MEERVRDAGGELGLILADTGYKQLKTLSGLAGPSGNISVLLVRVEDLDGFMLRVQDCTVPVTPTVIVPLDHLNSGHAGLLRKRETCCDGGGETLGLNACIR